MIGKQKEIIEHNSNIIEDNMFFGWKNGYSEKEINHCLPLTTENQQDFTKLSN
ncbi:hypothetical protein HB937_12005 [Listeria welshimeri]|nr:hypothetical protein [Listeria welshimeri]MBC1614059.1 hypothetical protein [Listeria welshimeri]